MARLLDRKSFQFPGSIASYDDILDDLDLSQSTVIRGDDTLEISESDTLSGDKDRELTHEVWRM